MTAFLIGAGYIAAGTFTFLLIYLLIGIVRNNHPKNDEQLKVSIIVAAHNEERILARCLEALSRQNYPRHLLEYIIVNDRSTDSTGKIIQRFENAHSNFTSVQIDNCPAGVSPKKNALSKGIEKAESNIILTTDADCIPPENWVKKMVEQFDEYTTVVIGYAPLISNNSFISKLTAFDAISNALIAHGSSGWNFPLTCTGRNFAYKKSFFIEVDGFDKIRHILTGDDDLLLLHMSKYQNFKMRFIAGMDSSVPSDAPNGIKEFITQRKRHLSGAKYFPKSVQIWFGIFFLSRLILLVSILGILLIDQAVLPPVLLLPYVFYFLLLFGEAAKMGQLKLLIMYPLWEGYYLLNQFILTPLSFFTKTEWGTRIAH